MKSEIVEKLVNARDKLRVEDDPFLQEVLVLYIVVQLRKLREGKKRTNYKVLKFYADWCLHPQKEHIDEEMREILKTLCEELNFYTKNPALVGTDSNILINEIVSMKRLREEINTLLREEGEMNFLEDNVDGDDFLNGVIKIIQNQPIIGKEGEDIKRLEFLKSSDFIYYLNITYKQNGSSQYLSAKIKGII